MSRPAMNEYPAYAAHYVSLADAQTVHELVEKYCFGLQEFYNSLPDEKADFAYAPGKWTIKELLLHVTDAERIFAYRILRISRGDTTPLPSFDENIYAENCGAKARALSSIKQEFNSVRAATDILLLALTEEQLQNRGMVSGSSVTANGIAFTLYGHLIHHCNILKEKYDA